MHLYDDIGFAFSSIRGSTSSFRICNYETAVDGIIDQIQTEYFNNSLSFSFDNEILVNV